MNISLVGIKEFSCDEIGVSFCVFDRVVSDAAM